MCIHEHLPGSWISFIVVQYCFTMFVTLYSKLSRFTSILFRIGNFTTAPFQNLFAACIAFSMSKDTKPVIRILKVYMKIMNFVFVSFFGILLLGRQPNDIFGDMFCVLIWHFVDCRRLKQGFLVSTLSIAGINQKHSLKRTVFPKRVCFPSLNSSLLSVIILISERVKKLLESIVDIALDLSLVSSFVCFSPLFGGAIAFAASRFIPWHRLMITLHNPIEVLFAKARGAIRQEPLSCHVFSSKIEWNLTNGPLSKLLGLLDTQVQGSVQWVLLETFWSLCWECKMSNITTC